MSSSTPPRSPVQRQGSFSTLVNPADDRGDYKPVPREDDVVEAKRSAQYAEPATSPVWPIMSYCAASILMTVVNKYVVSGRHFNMTFLLLFIQSSVCVLLVVICKRLRIISYGDFDISTAKKWFPISSCLVVVIYTGSKSLQYLSIPVYTIFKNLTIILIAYGEVIWFSGRVTGLMLVAFFLMVMSSVIAAWSDISSTLNSLSGNLTGTTPSAATLAGDSVSSAVSSFNIGYLWMFINCLASAAYILAMRKRIKGMSLKDWDTMFYNNLLPIPLLAVFSFIIEDWGSENLIANFPPETRDFLLFAMAFSGAAAVFISYSTAWCVRTTSSTTYSMVGALNKLPVAASGMVFFGDPATVGSVSAIGTGFFAGIVYSIAKNNQAKAEKAAKGEPVIPMHKVQQR